MQNTFARAVLGAACIFYTISGVALFFAPQWFYDNEDFSPPPPFTMEGLYRAGTLSEPVYTKAEMLGYLEHGGAKCRETIQTLTDARVRATWGFDDSPEKIPFGELLLYTMRHVQDHGAQLSLMLGQTHNLPPDWPDWVSRAKN